MRVFTGFRQHSSQNIPNLQRLLSDTYIHVLIAAGHSKLSFYLCWLPLFVYFSVFLESIWPPSYYNKNQIDPWIILDAGEKNTIWPNTDVRDTSRYVNLCEELSDHRERAISVLGTGGFRKHRRCIHIGLKRILRSRDWNRTKKCVKTTPGPVERSRVVSFSYSYWFLRERSTC